MNLLIMICSSLLFIGALVVALLITRRRKSEEVAAVEVTPETVLSEAADRTLPSYDGGLTPELAEFLYSNEETVFHLDITLDPYESLEMIDWVNGVNDEPIIWFSIEHDNGGTELGFFKSDNDIHITTHDKRAVTVNGLCKVESLQGPKDGWISVTVRSVK